MEWTPMEINPEVRKCVLNYNSNAFKDSRLLSYRFLFSFVFVVSDAEQGAYEIKR